MIKADGKLFVLNTQNTTYAFRVMETGQLEHMYYGKLIHSDELAVVTEKRAFAPGNTVTYNADHPELTMEDVCLEVSTYGKGDFREPMVTAICPDGSSTLDFIYDGFSVLTKKPEFNTLPTSYDEKGQVETLEITLKDKNHGYT